MESDAASFVSSGLAAGVSLPADAGAVSTGAASTAGAFCMVTSDMAAAGQIACDVGDDQVAARWLRKRRVNRVEGSRGNCGKVRADASDGCDGSVTFVARKRQWHFQCAGA